MKKIEAMNAYEGNKDLLQEKDCIFEPKLDGIRALCYVGSRSIHFMSRNGKDRTADYPELDIRKFVRARECILDGEVVSFDKKGRSDISLLKHGNTATYIVFDILYKDGKDLTHVPLLERKKILDETLIDSPRAQKIIFTHDGPRLWKEVLKRNLEGLMVKKEMALYYPGQRTHVWEKVKQHHSVDCIIIGFTSEKRKISALAVALYDCDSKLHYIGKIGTGYSESTLKELAKVLTPLTTEKNPTISRDKPLEKVIFVKPKVICEVKYAEFTPYHKMRMPVFIRLRPDKKPSMCTFKANSIPEP